MPCIIMHHLIYRIILNTDGISQKIIHRLSINITFFITVILIFHLRTPLMVCSLLAGQYDGIA